MSTRFTAVRAGSPREVESSRHFLVALPCVVVMVIATIRTLSHKVSFLTLDYRLAALLELTFAIIMIAFARVPVRRREVDLVRTFVLVAVSALALYGLYTRLEEWVGSGELTAPPITAWLHEHLASDLDRARYALAELQTSVADERLISSADQQFTALWIDPTWPLPSRVHIGAARVAGARVRLVADAGDIRCAAFVASSVGGSTERGDPSELAPQCGPSRSIAPELSGETAILITREQRTRLASATGSLSTSSWPQYRLDAARSGRVSSPSTGTRGWRGTTEGPIRGGLSVVGDVVVAASHGTGTVSAFDRASGRRLWVTREPNWVHQDAVSDGMRLAVGFGDNAASILGYAPGGVAVHDLRTGRRIWTHFTAGSVMVSPVFVHGLIVVATSARELIAFAPSDGTVRWATTMPGASTMGPPAVRGDTIFVGLDPNVVCAYTVDGHENWCVRVPNASNLGLSAVSLVGDELLATSTSDANWWTTLSSWWRPAARGFGQWLAGTAQPPVQRQQMLLLHAATGELDGRIELGEGRPPAGHSSGTAVPLSDSRFVAVVAPVPKQVMIVDLVRKAVTWRAALGAAGRGPLSIFPGDTAIVVNRIGVARVYDLRSAHQVCAAHLLDRFDRVGVVVTGDLSIIGSESGTVLAIPTADLLRCSVPLAK